MRWGRGAAEHSRSREQPANANALWWKERDTAGAQSEDQLTLRRSEKDGQAKSHAESGLELRASELPPRANSIQNNCLGCGRQRATFLPPPTDPCTG